MIALKKLVSFFIPDTPHAFYLTTPIFYPTCKTCLEIYISNLKHLINCILYHSIQIVLLHLLFEVSALFSKKKEKPY